MVEKLRVGIAGFGVVGKRRKACVDDRDDMECVAICDQLFAGDEQPEADLAIFSNYEALLSHPLDVLFVCLPNNLAADATVAGLHHGLHVFCEKPPGRNLEEVARVILEERQRPDLRLMYGFNHRFHESVEDALASVRTGELGSIISLRGFYGKSKLITFNQPDWRTKRELSGGGVLLDQGIHMVDLMRLFAGEFEAIHSFISNGHWGYDVEDNAYALMKSETGVVAQLTSSATQWRHRFSLDITLEKGSLVLGGILSGSKSYGAETLTIVYADPDSDNGDPREQTTLYNVDGSWEKEVAAFARCILDGEAIVTSGSRDAFLTMSLVTSIYHADPAWRERFAISKPATLAEFGL